MFEKPKDENPEMSDRALKAIIAVCVVIIVGVVLSLIM